MSSEEPDVGQSQDSGQEFESYPVVYDWEGQLVILYYTTGPRTETVGKTKTGELRSASAVCALLAVDEIGVLAKRVVKVKETEENEPKYTLSKTPRFFPWGSINSITPLFDMDDDGD